MSILRMVMISSIIWLFGVSSIYARDTYRITYNEKRRSCSELVVLDEYYKRIATIKPKHTSIVRDYRDTKLIIERENTPRKLTRGVSTFKERRSHNYGPRNSRRVY